MLFLFRTGLRNIVVAVLAMVVVSVLVLLNGIVAILLGRGWKGLVPVGRVASVKVFTAWLRKEFRVMMMRAWLAWWSSPNVVLPVLVLEPVKNISLLWRVRVRSCLVSCIIGGATVRPSARLRAVTRLSIVVMTVGRVRFRVPIVTFVSRLRHLRLLVLYISAFVLWIRAIGGALQALTMDVR